MKKRWWSDNSGNMSIIAAIMFPVLAIAVGVAVDQARLQTVHVYAQNAADNAALSVAAYLRTAKDDPDSACRNEYEDFEQSSAWRFIGFSCRRELRRIARASLDSFYKSQRLDSPIFRLKIVDGQVVLMVKGNMEAGFSQMIGKPRLPFSATSKVTIPSEIAKDVEIALIADATGSMQTTLDGVQLNMKDFLSDLETELRARDIDVDRVRIKFSFYRDFFADVDPRWSGPEMTIVPGMERRGPLYQSRFFTLPTDRDNMHEFIDFFVADGGASYAESGLEAIWYAIQDANWSHGNETVRAIIVWTDAPNRTLHDSTESYGLTPYSAVADRGADPATAANWWWSNEFWEDRMGSQFSQLSYDARRAYLYDEYYLQGAPSSLSAFKVSFDRFHNENSNGMSGIPTLTVNIIPNYGTGAPCPTPCGDWDTMDSWEGVDVLRSPDVVSASETYHMLVQQVADTVEDQLIAKRIVIKS